MTQRYSRADLRRGRFRRTSLGRALLAALGVTHGALGVTHGALGEILVGISLGRVVVLLRAANAPVEANQQVAIAIGLATSTRAFLVGAGWWGRLLARSAVVVAFEAEEVSGGCAVLRYTECVVTTAASGGRSLADGTIAGRLSA